ncbi:MAG: ComF family protein [Ruminococcus sp.]|nr:ComF family protein [Ruminococcus sp.]
MSTVRKLTALFFPERCPYCDELIEPCEIACERCYDEIRRKHAPIFCGAHGFRCVSAFVYDAKVRRMILRLKYHERIQYIPQIAELMAEDIRAAYGDNAFDIITCVPMHQTDLRRRGYNQSRLMAQALSSLLDIPYRDTIDKVKKTKKQHHLKYAERKTNLNGAFALIDKESIKGQRILLIDDIVTSGYTLGNCGKTLNRGKPSLICCATIASAHNKYPESTVI